MTTDCRVDVAPYCKVTDPAGIDFPEFVYDANGNIEQKADADGLYNNKKSGGTRHFAQGEYVPVDYLNEGNISENDIAKTELIYSHNGEEYYQPYYKFYVKLSGSEFNMAEGLKNFGIFYVPAVSGAYLINN